jgi:hypothetical protein
MRTPRIMNQAITAANEEHIFTFPDFVRGYQFQARTNVDIIYSWQQGQVGPGPLGTYMTLKAGGVAAHDEGEGAAIIQPTSMLYFACAVVGTVLEVEVW